MVSINEYFDRRLLAVKLFNISIIILIQRPLICCKINLFRKSTESKIFIAEIWQGLLTLACCVTQSSNWHRIALRTVSVARTT